MYSHFKVTAQMCDNYTITYSKIESPPPLASFSNDPFAAIEAVMATYAHVGCLQLLQGVDVQLCRLVATIFAFTVAPRLP